MYSVGMSNNGKTTTNASIFISREMQKEYELAQKETCRTLKKLVYDAAEAHVQSAPGKGAELTFNLMSDINHLYEKLGCVKRTGRIPDDD